MDGIYLDNAATTPISEKSVEAMTECMRECWGNPSSLHMTGQKAAAKLEEARDIIASVIGATPDEILFTSGATESNNLAIRGLIKSLGKEKTMLVTQETEHPSVRETALALSSEMPEVLILPVDDEGRLCMPDDCLFRDSLIPVVSIMHTNNETGRLFPVKELCEKTHEAGGYYHCDAVQAVGKMPVNVSELGIDMMSASAHKFHGPKGTGFLYVRKGTPLKNVTFGGEQERRLRPGTVDVPSIFGMAAALKEASENMEEASLRMKHLKELLLKMLIDLGDIHVNAFGEDTSPAVLNMSFGGLSPDMLLYALDSEGLRVSAGSACSAGSLEVSHVIKAMGAEKYGAPIRFSFSSSTTEEEVIRAAEIVRNVVSRLRS